MGNFGNKWNKFVQIFIEKNGYVKVVQGLQNTLLIAVVGMLIGVLIGTIIATVRVLPKYKTLPRALNAVCSFYVGLFRGTPMVVQLLIFYYVMLPLMGIKLPGVRVAMVVFGLNSGAYISEIMRSGIQSVDPGQLEAGRAVGLGFGPAMIRIVIPQAVKNILPTLGNCPDQGNLRCQLRRRGGSLRCLQLYRKQQLRVHGPVSCHGGDLHRSRAGDLNSCKTDGKEPEEE